MSLSNNDDESKIGKFDIFNEQFPLNVRYSNKIFLRKSDEFTPTPTAKNKPQSNDDNILYIILIVVGVVVIIIIIVIIVVCVKKKKRQRVKNMD